MDTGAVHEGASKPPSADLEPVTCTCSCADRRCYLLSEGGYAGPRLVDPFLVAGLAGVVVAADVGTWAD